MLAALLLADGRFPAGSHAHSAGVEAACADGRITDEPSLAEFLEGRLRTTGLVDAALATATNLTLTTTVDRTGLHLADAVHDGPHGAADDADVRWALIALDGEAEARIVAPSLRAASCQLGRQLVRVARRCWPSDVLTCLADALPNGAHQPVALGAVGVAAGCEAAEVARLAVHHVLTTPAQAAVRLLGLDPFAVAALTAHLAPLADQVATSAVTAARCAVADACATGGAAVTDVGAVHAEVTDAGRAGPATRSVPRIRHAALARGLAGLPAFSAPLVEIAAAEHAGWEVRMFAT
jgi:urease accessory protein